MRSSWLWTGRPGMASGVLASSNSKQCQTAHRSDFPNSDRLPRVVVYAADVNHARGRNGGLVLDGLEDLGDVWCTGFFRGLGPEVNADVSGLHGIACDFLLAKTPLVSIYKTPILRAGYALEVVPTRVIIG